MSHVVHGWSTAKKVGASGIAAIGLIASCIGIHEWWHQHRLVSLIDRGRGLLLGVQLAEPSQGLEVHGDMTSVTGRLDIKVMAADVLQAQSISAQDINVRLEQRELEVVPFVRPLSEAKWWWAQAVPHVESDGTVHGYVYVGDKTNGRGIKYELRLLVVPKDSVTEGEKSTALPFAYASSKPVVIQRVD
jgi:hypothetical protein